ncbi:uncharacterized protein BO97DRAFT_472824 [Aspergillus homomorphus CBS 101889]|uniref:Uncharacterized protein n=1 Tax=Aspergillus homomorphus (strain CBS 101889) TaxID=1450537 RepID=A0A395HNC5_ASPHC|nr:hypothetical protein BO97DRAFT_472824 [Aspergillus homomorphus CBS 101889]RAL08923.1 hypothetical protein BO97DRAFT_472824 [Aspergillus homomorphus CBS 101889]
MALPLFIPPCIRTPRGQYHLPPPDKPLRVQIEGPLVAIKKLLPHISWCLSLQNRTFPQPAGPELARLTYRAVYGQDVSSEVSGDLVVRDESLGWMPQRRPEEELIDYDGVTFDHLVPAEDTDPEVMQINIIEIEDDKGVYANKWLAFEVDPSEYIGKKVLAVPRCCQKRKGTQDRWRVNALVDQRMHGREHLEEQKAWEARHKLHPEFEGVNDFLKPSAA